MWVLKLFLKLLVMTRPGHLTVWSTDARLNSEHKYVNGWLDRFNCSKRAKPTLLMICCHHSILGIKLYRQLGSTLNCCLKLAVICWNIPIHQYLSILIANDFLICFPVSIWLKDVANQSSPQHLRNGMHNNMRWANWACYGISPWQKLRCSRYTCSDARNCTRLVFKSSVKLAKECVFSSAEAELDGKTN